MAIIVRNLKWGKPVSPEESGRSGFVVPSDPIERQNFYLILIFLS